MKTRLKRNGTISADAPALAHMGLVLSDVGAARVYFVDSPRDLTTPWLRQVVKFAARRRVMSETVQSAAGTAAIQRYESLFRVSQTLISIRSSEELFRLLARELRSVVSFYVMSVGFYDENTHEVRLTSYGEAGDPIQVPTLAPEETFTWWVYQHQQPLIIPSLDTETRFPAVAELLKNRGIRSICAVPLTTVHRRVGDLALGSAEADAYGTDEVAFLSLVANQVVQAVDNALHFDASLHAKEILRGSEESFRQIVDSMPAFAWCASPDGKLEYLNRGIVDYTAKRQEDLVGFGWAKVLHPQDIERTKKAWLHSVETGEPCDVEQRVSRFDGVYRWFRTVAQPLRDHSGRVIRWYGVATDIDERKRAEEALRASELNLRLVVDTIPGLVCTMSAAGEVETLNRQVLEYFGKTAEELKSWATSDAVHPDDLARVLAAFTRSIETGQPYDIEHRCRRADGVYRWFQVRALPVRDTEGGITGWYILLTDIDERKQAEGRLQLLLDVTNQVVSNLQLSDLLGAISSSVRRVMQCDLVSVCFPDSEMKRLQTFVIDFPDSKGFIREELISIEGSLGGFVFRTGKPWAGNASDLLHSGLKNDPAIAEGLKTGCVLPLISRNSVLGVLALGRREDNPFSQIDIGFLTQVASQIAIAVENASAYREVAQARAELEKAFEEIKHLKDRLQDENVALREQIDQALMFEEIVGVSPALRAVLSRVSKVAPTDSTVLLTGETGTGKELIARAIYKRSRRSSRAFVNVNCAAIPASLIASELFGHERGAFTGATQRRLGRFELAEEGTIFLDEVGELPAETQITLLHVLQEREFERVGGNQSIRANARVIAATNRDLEAAIAEGAFRSDLFYRLNVFPIEIPPLRQRREDIPLLVEYFIDRFARKAGKSIRGINKKTLDLLLSYPWPGNIRELQNVIERSVILCETESFSVDESWLSRKPLVHDPNSHSQKLAAQEKEMIEAALRESGGRVSGPSGAAARLGLHRSTLESKIISLNINKYGFKTGNSSKAS